MLWSRICQNFSRFMVLQTHSVHDPRSADVRIRILVTGQNLGMVENWLPRLQFIGILWLDFLDESKWQTSCRLDTTKGCVNNYDNKSIRMKTVQSICYPSTHSQPLNWTQIKIYHHTIFMRVQYQSILLLLNRCSTCFKRYYPWPYSLQYTELSEHQGLQYYGHKIQQIRCAYPGGKARGFAQNISLNQRKHREFMPFYHASYRKEPLKTASQQ